MLRKLISNIHRQRSYRSFKNRDYRRAIDQLKKVENYRSLKIPEKAYLATLEIGANNSARALSILNQLLTQIDKEQLSHANTDIKYVILYSKLYLSLINKTGDHNLYYEEMKQITPKGIISEYLPIPDSVSLFE